VEHDASLHAIVAGNGIAKVLEQQLLIAASIAASFFENALRGLPA